MSPPLRNAVAAEATDSHLGTWTILICSDMYTYPDLSASVQKPQVTNNYHVMQKRISTDIRVEIQATWG